MLHIILLILKVIGIILAALLGILLAVILLVLFVPIGYSAELDNREDILVKANGWWLFHFLHVSFVMEGIPSEEKGKSPVIKVKILGIPIIDTSRQKEEKQAADVVMSEKVSEKTQSEEPTKEPEIQTQELTGQKEDEQKVIESKETEPKEKAEKKPDKKPVKKKASVRKEIEKKERKKISEQIAEFFENLKKKKRSILETIEKIKGKADLIKSFFADEENKQGIKKSFQSLKKILKHLLPNKIKGQVQFGLNDPCATGQVLGVLAMFYPYYGKSLFIEPDFSRQVLEGNLYIKGYIQIFTLCIIGIKLVINANFRKLIKNFMKLKEEI